MQFFFFPFNWIMTPILSKGATYYCKFGIIQNKSQNSNFIEIKNLLSGLSLFFGKYAQTGGCASKKGNHFGARFGMSGCKYTYCIWMFFEEFFF
ncbi:MAG: hypothetical protein CM15mP111_3730 [Hyphomicrobiales bacterium]|nr:MAG: hypothetical protein CM15mP111_3730 [Hyphomicrobiales bacterium]